MANWDTLKSAIAGVIGTNGNQAITGQVLQNVLHNIISSVGENATFAGIATPTTNPGVPDGPVFYLATTAGIYANFNGAEVIEGEAAILQWNNGAWSKKNSGLATQQQFDEIYKIINGVRLRATSIFYGALEMTFGTYSIAVSLTRTVQGPYIYHESGYCDVNKEISKVLQWEYSSGVVVVYYDQEENDILLASSTAGIPLTGIILEAFYSYGGGVTRVLWTSPFIIKNNYSADGTYCSFLNPKEIEDMKSNASDIKNSLAGLRATGTLFADIDMAFYSGGVTVNAKLSQPNGYLYHENGYADISNDITKTFTFGVGHVYIYYDTEKKDILLSQHDFPVSAIILEAFYSYSGAVTKVFWTSPFIAKTGFTNYNSNCSFSNPKEVQALSDNILELNNSIYGKTYSKTYQNIDGQASYSVDVNVRKGTSIKVSYNASVVLSCVLGVYFEDGTSHFDIATLYSPDETVEYIAEDNVSRIVLYIANSGEVQSFTINAEIEGLSKSIQASRPKATSIFFGTLEMSFSPYSVLISLTKTSQGPYLYYESGYYSINKEISKTLEWNSSYPIVIIYYDNERNDILIASSLGKIPLTGVILEAFYSYGGAVTKVFWTSPFIKKNNYSAPNDHCSFSNPKEIQELLQLKTNKPKALSAKIFQRVGCIGDSYTAGYISTGNNFSNGSPENAWPHYMESLTNNKYDNWGVSGSTAKGWVLGAANLSKVKEEGNKCQAYIIGLMINDRSNASWNSYYTPVGTIADIGTDADSYYAYYYKLIQEVISVNDKAFIFCNTCPKWSATDAYNVAVKDIVAYCKSVGQNVYLCDLASSTYAEYYNDDTFEKDYINGHYTSIGYEYMAECYIQILSDIINANVAEFQNVAFIPFDK